MNSFRLIYVRLTGAGSYLSRNSLVKNLSLLGIAEGATQVSILIISVVIARRLGEEGLGFFSIVSVVATMISFPFTSGVSSLVVREVAQAVEVDRVIKTILQVRLVFIVAVVFLAIGILFFLPSTYRLVFIVVVLQLIVEGGLIFLLMVGRGLRWFKLEAGTKLAKSTLAVVGALGAAQLFGGVHLIYAVTVWQTAVAGVLFLICARLISSRVRFGLSVDLSWFFKLEWSTFKPSKIFLGYITQAVILGLSALMWFIYYKIDNLILGVVAGVVAVGIYTAAYSVVKMAGMVSSLIGSSLLPVLAKAANSGDGGDVAKGYIRGAIGLGSVAAVVFWVLSEPVLGILYGDAFMASVIPARWLAVSLVFIFPSNIVQNTFVAYGKEWLSLKITFVAALLNVILNFAFIYYMGYMGAVITTILTEGFVFIVGVYLINRQVFNNPIV